MTFYPEDAAGQQSADQEAAADWYPDPHTAGQDRYWDGVQWTEYVRATFVPSAPEPTWQQQEPAWQPAQQQHSEHQPHRSAQSRRPALSRRLALLAVIVVGLFASFQYGGAGSYLPDVSAYLPNAGAAENRISSLGKQPVLEGEYPVFGSTELVNELERAMLAQEASIDVTAWAKTESPAALLRAAQEAATQNPYIFASQWEVNPFSSKTAIVPTYTYHKDDADQRRADTRAAVARGIASGDVIRATTDAEKVTRIHDFIVERATYDYSALNSIDRGVEYALLSQSQEAYGILVAGTAVCAGYSQAFVAMAEEVGLDAVVITGTDGRALTGALHAWNKVLIDGQWLLVDTTWDEPLDDGDGVLHDYLLLESSDPLLETRQADTEWAVHESLALFD